MSISDIDALLDYQNIQTAEIAKLKRQLAAAKGQQTKLQNQLNELNQAN